MIEIFDGLRPESELDDLLDRAKRTRDNDTALGALATALLHTHAREAGYARVVERLGEVLVQKGEHRAALSTAWYSADRARQEALLDRVPAIDRARTYAAWARAEPSQAAELYRRAAGELEQEGKLVRAAIYYERAEDVEAARALWSRLSGQLDLQSGEPYAAGLSRFNVARTSRAAGDERAARDATVAAVHRLEEAADRFESIGQRERAFDCYHVLIAVGELSGLFEHVLEGVVNAIRILGEDNLRYHALRLYEHAIELAERAGESSAAATLAREMTAFALKQGLPRVAARGTLRQSQLWQHAAESLLERGAPPELVENALLASLLASAEAGQYARVGSLYQRLVEIDLEPARKQHYARAAKRYEGATNAGPAGTALDDRFGRHVAPPDLWHVDLIEWEENGSAAEACADLLLDPDETGDRITMRAALTARLVALDAEATPENARGAVVLANYLAPIGLYTLLSALEKLYTRPEPAVRLAAVQALSRYFFKRTFVTLGKALGDRDAKVSGEAVKALERLRFEHACDPLSRIYRTSDKADARIAALRALARIDVDEAAELLLGALDHGGPDERTEAIRALSTARGTRFLDAAREAYPQGSQRLREGVKEVFDARGMAI